jgi:lysyl-tRNA synthetase class 2
VPGRSWNTAELVSALQQRSRAQAVIRRHFADQGFVEALTPTRVDCPGTDVYIDPVQSQGRWLITSPEFHHKRLLAAGVERLFEFARCFRHDECGPFHQPEFTLLEWYRCPAQVESVMADTEWLVHAVASALSGGQLVREQARSSSEPPFERLTVREAFRRFAGIDDVASYAREREDDYFQAWVDHVEPGMRGLLRPTFLLEFPLSQAALARPCPEAPEYAERFELFVHGVELCNGYGELTDPVEQRRRFEHDNARRRELGKPALPIDEGLLSALAELRPAAGNALGFDRLLALCLGTTLDGVVPFAEG